MIERPHRLVPFLSGAALAIILDTGVEMLRSQPDDPSRPDTIEVHGTIRGEPWNRPEVVPREPERPVEQPKQEPRNTDPETRPSYSRRSNTPMPSAKEVDAQLTRALGRRGLELDDLDRIDSVRAHVAKLRSARKGSDGRDVDSALAALVAALENAGLSHSLLNKKLDQVRTVLTQSESAITKDRFQILEERYLDAKLELSRLSEAQLGPFAVKLSKLLSEIRAAKSG